MAPNPYSATLWFIAAIALTLGFAVWLQRTMPARRLFAALCWAVSLWCFGYGCELTAKSLEEMRLWSAIQYPGIVLVAPLWLLFAIRYVGRRDVRHPAILAAVFSVPAVTLIALWTNEWHHLYYSARTAVHGPGIQLQMIQPGPVYMFHMLYAWACVLGGLVVLFRHIRAVDEPFSQNLLLLFLAGLIPFGVALARAFGFQPYDALDPTPFGFATGIALLAVMTMRRRLLMLRPIARDMVVNSFDHGLLVLDAQGCVTDANWAMGVMLGRPQERVSGHWTKVFEDAGPLPTLLAANSHQTAEMTLGAGTSARTVHVTCSPIFNESNELMGHALLFRDITEYRRTREALIKREKLVAAQAEASLRLLSRRPLPQAVQEALALVGEATEVDRVYVFQNRIEDGEVKLYQIFEWVREGVTAQIGNDELQGLPYSRGYQRWFDLLSSGRAVQGHVREFPDEEKALLEEQDILSLLVIPIHLGGTFWGFMGFDECHEEREWLESEVDTLRGLAAAIGGAIERDQAWAQLQKSEHRLRTYFEMPVTGLVLAKPDGTIVEANEVFLAMLGYTKAEVVGKNWTSFLQRDDGAHAEEWPAGPDVSNSHWRSSERHFRRKDGVTVVAVVAERLSHSPEGDPEQLMLAVQDITELRQKERELEHLNANLRQIVEDRTLALTNTVDELEAFEQGIANELSEPLRIAREFVSRLLKAPEFAHNNDARRDLQFACDALVGMHGTIREMRRLHESVRGPLMCVRMNLADVARVAVREMREKYPHHHVDVNIATELWSWADPRPMEVFFREVLDNAWKFTGPVSQPMVEIGRELTEHGWAFYVRDNGVGIPEGMSYRLFRVFDRLHSEQDFPGRGLGLAIAHRVITRHEGRIWATGAPGQGFTLYFTLPEPPPSGGE